MSFETNTMIKHLEYFGLVGHEEHPDSLFKKWKNFMIIAMFILQRIFQFWLSIYFPDWKIYSGDVCECLQGTREFCYILGIFYSSLALVIILMVNLNLASNKTTEENKPHNMLNWVETLDVLLNKEISHSSGFHD